MPRALKANRFTRIVVLAWTVIGALVIAEIGRGLLAIGLFAPTTPVSPGVCHAIALQGPGDLVADAKDQTLFIAASDRRRTNNPADGIYYLRFGGAAPVKLAGTPPDFHPQALSLGHETDGTLALLAVNRKSGDRVTVESFTVAFADGVPHLSYVTSIQSGLVVRAGGIAALGALRFYLANDPTRNDIIAWLERYALLPRADLLYFNGAFFREAVNGLSDPSGVLLSPDSRRLLVASRNERRLIGFSLDPFSGDLKEMGALALPARLEHMTIDSSGDVWIAGVPKLPALTGFDKDSAKPAPSAVFRVHLDADGAPQSYETMYADDGHGIGAASAAASADGHLFIGSALDGKLLDCTERWPGKV